MSSKEKIYPLPPCTIKPDPYLTYTEGLRKSKTPLIIDNGSCYCKAGWASEISPSLIFRNHVAKHRGKKENAMQVGNDIKNVELVRWILKTQFDRNVVTQFDVQETIFDHIFSHLRINSSGCVDHPVVLMEAICNPSYSRQLMTELLFECYQVPKIAYGVDALFSFNYNNRVRKGKNGLIVSLGYNTIHILPVLNEKLDVHNTKRINIGGQHMTNYFHRILQLKYPVHASAITLSRAESLMHKHMLFSKNYREDIHEWTSDDYYDQNLHKIQLPYVPLPGSSMTSAGKLEKCHAMLRRVQSIRIKQRAEKLAYDEERLQELQSVQDLIEDDDDEAILALQELGYTSTTELQAGIKKLNCNIRKIKNLMASQLEKPQESPLSDWCEELNPKNFSDAETWTNAVIQRRKELFEKRQKLSSDKLKSIEFGGFSSTTANDLFGGIFNDSGEILSFQGKANELEELKDQIKILDEILAEYNRETAKSQQNISFNLAEYYQLHLGIEKIRVPELIFQPCMIGIEQAGIVENIEMVLAKYTPEDQQKIAENIFITGGCAKIPFIKERLENEILAIRPFQSKFHVYLADNPLLDAWKGAKQWALTGDNISRFSVTLSDYKEKGGDYLKEHACSNYYVPSPILVQKAPVVTPDAKAERKTL